MYSLRPNEGTQIETDRTTPMPKSRAELHSTYWTKKGSLEVLKHTRIFKNEGIQFSSFFLNLCAFYTNIKKQLVRKLDMILLKTVLF